MNILDIERKLCYAINKAITVGLEKKDYFYWRDILSNLYEQSTSYDSVYQIVIPAVEQLLYLINNSGIMNKISKENVNYIANNTYLLPLVLANSNNKNIKLTNQNSYMFLCPFHDDRKPSFSVTDYKNLGHCFGCDKTVNVIAYLQNIEKLSFTEAVELLSYIYNIDLKFNNERLKTLSIKYKQSIISDEYNQLLKAGYERYINRDSLTDEVKMMYDKRFNTIDRIKNDIYDYDFVYQDNPKTIKLTLDQIK